MVDVQTLCVVNSIECIIEMETFSYDACLGALFTLREKFRCRPLYAYIYAF